VRLLWKIWIHYVMLNSFLGYLVFYICFSVCICWTLGRYKYHHLIVKKHVEFTMSGVALKILNSLCDIELILGIFFVFYFCLNVCIFWTLGCYEYHYLIIKTHVEFTKSEVALKNLNSLCDVELVLGLFCTLHLFECVHMSIKFAQCKDMFVYNFVNVIS